MSSQLSKVKVKKVNAIKRAGVNLTPAFILEGINFFRF